MLAAALGAVAWFGWPRSPQPGRGHVRWMVRATLAFGLPCIVALVVLGRAADLTRLPPEFLPLAGRLPWLDPVALLPSLALGVPLGIAFVQLRIWYFRWRRRPLPRSIVAPAPLAARTNRELLPATATALAAGVTEELAFRLAIPLLVAIATAQPLLGFIVATAVFVALHRYQAWQGMVGVALLSVAFILLYLATRALWLVMLCHAAVDVAGLAIRPWLARFGVSSSNASRS